MTYHPTLGPLSHVGIATQDLAAAISRWRQIAPDLLVGERIPVAEQGVEVVFLDFASHPGHSRLELLTDISAGGRISQFIATRGEGIHHLCFTCADIRAELARLKKAGFRLIDETPRIGALGKPIAFIHPLTAGGVLLELEEESGAAAS